EIRNRIYLLLRRANRNRDWNVLHPFVLAALDLDCQQDSHFAQLGIQLLPPQNCRAQPREWNETGLGVGHHLENVQLHRRLSERVAYFFRQLCDVRVWDQAHSSPPRLNLLSNSSVEESCEIVKRRSLSADPQPSGTSLRGYGVPIDVTVAADGRTRHRWRLHENAEGVRRKQTPRLVKEVFAHGSS